MTIDMLVDGGCNMKGCYNVTTTEQPPQLKVHWLENEAVAGFRVWQIMFLCFAGILTLIMFLCCCIRFRIPRTKQEIEADYIRKRITKKFRKQLRTIQNSDMDEMDLKRALDRIRAEFKSDTESLAQSDALSEATLSSGNYRETGTNKNVTSPDANKKESAVGLSLEEIMEKERKSSRRFSTIASLLTKFKTHQKPHDVVD